MNKCKFLKIWFMVLMLSAFAGGCAENRTDGGSVGGGSPGGVSLVSIAVTPATASIPVTGTQQYTATAIFSDGSSLDVTASSSWTSANVPVGGAAVATLSPNGVGLATGNLIGQSDITATYGGKTAPAARLTVTSATVVSILLTPATASIPVNGTLQLKAYAILSDGSPPFDVTANPATTWFAANVPDGGAAVVTLSPDGIGAGLATGNIIGQSDIIATFGGITSPASRLTVFSSQLGFAATFGIMATSAVTNTGFSIINGDVSLDPGTSMTGFPPGVVNGTIHINDTVSAQARLDLLAAYNYFVNLPPGTTVSAGADLGALNPGGVLPPGTYTSGSTMLISTPVTLNGTATDVWVFQIGSSLTTSANVILGPGVLANNVFWVPALDATIGVGSTFSGTIVAGRDVTGVTGATINGRILAGATTAGTIALQTTTVNVPAP